MEEIMPENVTLREPGDFASLRKGIYDGAKKAFEQSFPVSFGRYRMEVKDVDYDGPEDYDLHEQKRAILGDKFLSRKLRGTVNLVEQATNRLVDSKRVSLMRVPHLTERGTFVHGGNEYTTINQARLLSGVYTRRQANGALETQFNPKPGTGRGFRVALEPATAQYHLKVGQSAMHLYSLLHDLGVPDEQLEAQWGPQILEQNRKKYDARVFEKAFQRLVHPREQPNFAERADRAKAIQDALNKVQVHEGVLRENLPNFFDQTKAASWLASHEQLQKAAAMEKSAAEHLPFAPDLTAEEVLYDVGHWFDKSADFTPDLNADDMRTEINSIVGKVGPRISSMKQWPSSWLTPGNPLGWLQWFQKYSNGSRGQEDDHQIMRWKRFKALQVPKFQAAPTARRAFTLRNWAIDPEKLVAPDKVSWLKEEMANYRAQATDRWMQQKSAAEDSADFADFVLGEFEESGVKSAKLHGTATERLARLYRRKGLDQDGNLPLHADGSVLSHEELDAMWEGRFMPAKVEVCTPSWDEPSHRKSARKPECIAVDFDGTLAERVPGEFDPEKTGEPVESILQYCKDKIDDGHEVAIFTARAHDPKAIPPIKRWAKKHGLGDVDVTNEKHPRFTRIVDDRAVAIRPDTGETMHRKLAADDQHTDTHCWRTTCKKCGGVSSCRCTQPKKDREIEECYACQNPDLDLPWRRKKASVKCPACGATPGKYRIHGDAIQCGECEKTSDMEAWEGPEKSAGYKEILKKKRMREEEYQCCPHCNHEFREKGGPRIKDHDAFIWECRQCGGEIVYPEMTDEEIDSHSWGGDSWKAHLRKERDKRRALRKEARLSYDHDEVEKNRVAARKVTVAPKSAEQAEAGNYTKGRFWWNGLQIVLENPSGSVRRDWKHDPPWWTTKMVDDYGYIRQTISEADEDHLDCFVGPWLDSGVVYVVNQHRNDGTFDEHKCMLGYTTEKEARDGYLAHYEKGWKGLKSITPLTVEQFKKWAKGGDTKNPMKNQELFEP